MRNIEELITVDNLPCEDCNFKTDPSTCWHFGKMPFAEVHNIALHGCDKHRPWWTTSTVHIDISESK